MIIFFLGGDYFDKHLDVLNIFLGLFIHFPRYKIVFRGVLVITLF